MKTFEPGQTVFAYNFPRDEVVEATVEASLGPKGLILDVTCADGTKSHFWVPGTFLTAAEAQAYGDAERGAQAAENDHLAFAKRITKGRVQ